MAEIRPFRGYRFKTEKPEELGKVVAPPYDMIDAERIDRLYETDPRNVARIIQNRSEPEDTENRDRHKRAAGLLREWIDGAVLVRDQAPGFYVYRQRFSLKIGEETVRYERLGVTTQVKLVDFDEGIIQPHEYTLSGPKVDRYELLEETGFNTGQIFGIVRDDGTVFEAIRAAAGNEPVGSFTDEFGVEHELITVTDPSHVQALTDAVRDRELLIADGHHRYETSLQYAKSTGRAEDGFVMMTLVSMADTGLIIRPFHRVVKNNGYTEKFRGIDDLRAFFNVRTIGPADVQDVFGYLEDRIDDEILYLDAAGKTMYGLTTNESGKRFLKDNPGGMSELWNNLNVSKVNRFCVAEAMKKPLDGSVLHDVMEYVNDARGAFEMVLRAPEEFTGVFFLRPIDIETVRRIVSQNERMPQKSTNFFPKLYSGLVLNKLGD